MGAKAVGPGRLEHGLMRYTGACRPGIILVALLCFIPLSAFRAEAANAVFSRDKTTPTNAPIRFSSPVLVDLDGNRDTLEIVIGDELGYVYGIGSQGNTMWVFSVRNFPGYEWVQTACQSSPAVADLDGDGALEVVVTLASRDEYVPQKPGAVFMFRLAPGGWVPTTAGGFVRLMVDRDGDNVLDGAFPSPTVSDLDGDGRMEIIAGAWDQICYALRLDGSPFWNLDNDPTDNQEHGFKAGDTIWTTPAIADIDWDLVPEVVLGADAHDFPWGHQVPYQMHNGGLLLVLEGPTGRLEVGPGKFFHESYHPEGAGYYYNPAGENHVPVNNISEVFQSSPVVADVDADGLPEIVHGTGQTYYRPRDDQHNRIFCWNAENATRRWAAYTGAEVFASPAVANVDADPELEIFARTFDYSAPKMYGINGISGIPIAGFPVPIQPGNPRSIGAVIGDVDGDLQMEILVVSYGRLHVFGPTGFEESGFNDCPNLMFTSPAIGDIDNDGLCELVLGNSEGVWIYQCNSGPVGVIPWGQYRRDAINSGVVPLFDARPKSVEILGPVVGGMDVPVRVTFENMGSTVWTSQNIAVASQSPAVLMLPVSPPPGTWVANGQTLVVEFQAPAPMQLGQSAFSFRLVDFNGVPFGGQLERPFSVSALRTSAKNWRLFR